MLRNFADLGGRAPIKENGDSLYKVREHPGLINRLVIFAMDLGLRTTTLDKLRRLPIDGKPNPKYILANAGPRRH